MINKIIALWRAKTPKIARALQALSGSVAALPVYYTSLPEEFKATIKPNLIGYICLAGLAITALLNLFKTSEK